MLALLLLCLLPGSMANQVCFNITNGHLKMTGDLLGLELSHKCSMRGLSCWISCTNPAKTAMTEMFNGNNNQCANTTAFTVTEGTRFIINYLSNTLTNCTVGICIEQNVLQFIKKTDTPNVLEEGLYRLFFIRSMCRELFHKYPGIRKAFIKVERKVIHNIMKRTKLESGGLQYYFMKELALHVVNISQDDLTAAGNNDRILVDMPQLLPQNQSSIPETWLPVDALSELPPEERTVGLVSYMQHRQFQFQLEDIPSMVIRIERMGEKPFSDLNTSVQMIFNITGHTSLRNDSRLLCHFFDEHDDWHWKTDGCETFNTNYDDHTKIECSCNHTTPFAVLLIRDPMAEIHWKILSYISYIGCALSAFFTVLSIVTYIISGNNKDHSISIHVSLSGALFLLNTSFMLSEWGATLKTDWVCLLIAVVMHYSLLSSFTWTAVEAFHLYLLMIRVFNTHYKHYMAKMSLAGWGIPGVIVGIAFGVKDIKQFYGFTEITLAEGNKTNAICWITDDIFFYGVNLTYISLVFIINLGVLLAVASKICRLKSGSGGKSKAGASKKLPLACKDILTVLGLTCLLGTTWGLAFLSSGYINYLILYLFCILNSLQGFFMFLWICGNARKQRKRAQETQSISNSQHLTTSSSAKSSEPDTFLYANQQ